jgi:hypothetical protein
MLTADSTTPLKRDVLGRVTLPAAQREALLDEFERSGLMGRPFAKLLGVNYPTFASWIQKRRRARGDYAALAKPPTPLTEVRPPQRHVPNATLRLVEVVTTPALPAAAELNAAPQAAALEVRLPGGASMLVTDSTQAALAAQILRHLHTSC